MVWIIPKKWGIKGAKTEAGTTPESPSFETLNSWQHKRTLVRLSWEKKKASRMTHRPFRASPRNPANDSANYIVQKCTESFLVPKLISSLIIINHHQPSLIINLPFDLHVAWVNAGTSSRLNRLSQIVTSMPFCVPWKAPRHPGHHGTQFQRITSFIIDV